MKAAIAAALATAAGFTGVPSTTVGIGVREFHLSTYKASVPAGAVKLSLHNYGEDSHDVAVATRTGRVLGVSPEAKPGDNAALTVRLRPGTYVLVCTVADHAARGMRAKLVVKR